MTDFEELVAARDAQSCLAACLPLSDEEQRQEATRAVQRVKDAAGGLTLDGPDELSYGRLEAAVHASGATRGWPWPSRLRLHRGTRSES